MKHILIALTVIITSFFFFPFEFSFLPGINTKMMMGVVGIVLFVFHTISNKKGIVVSQEIFVASIIACVFSLVGFYSVVYNNTADYSYATYIVSMLVWVGAAYTVCFFISQLHGHISVKLVINYLIGVCVLQCIMALLIDNIPSLKLLVDTYIPKDAEMLHRINRLYGIGATLDIAGTRFSAVLTMIAVLLCHDEEIRSSKNTIVMYVFLFILIAVIGSMVARTTNVGIILGVLYIIYTSGVFRIRIQKSNLKIWGMLISVSLFLVIVCIYLYNHVPAAQKLLFFAFEGFINWIETGEWSTGSTDELQTMWIFPETTKTWIIGDGYLANPTGRGHYMGTDVGYLRFIFYCGVIGLVVFSIFFMYLTAACYKRFPQEKNLFLLLLILVFVVWVKVSTDIFLVYAIFMCIPMVQKHTNNQLMSRL